MACCCFVWCSVGRAQVLTRQYRRWALEWSYSSPPQARVACCDTVAVVLGHAQCCQNRLPVPGAPPLSTSALQSVCVASPSVRSEARWPHAIVFQTHGGFAESVPYLLQKGSALSGLPRLDRFDVSHGHLVQELDVPALDIHVAPMSEVGISLTAFTTMCHRAPRSPKMWMHGSAHNLLLFRLTNLLRHGAPTRALQHVGPCAYCHRAPHARQRGHQTKRSHTGEEDEVAVTPRKRQRPSTAKDGRYTTNQNTAANMPTDCRPAPLIYYAPKSAGDVDQIRGWATEWGGVR